MVPHRIPCIRHDTERARHYARGTSMYKWYMELREQGIMLEELVVHGTERARHYARGTSMYKWYRELREQGIMLEELLCTSVTWN